MKLVPSIPVLTSPILLAGLIGGALTIGAASLPVTALVDQFYGDVQKAGGKRWDTSSLITRL